MANKILEFRIASKCQDGHFAFRYMLVTATCTENRWGDLDERCGMPHIGKYQSAGDIERFIDRLDITERKIFEGDWVRVEIDDTFEEVTKTALIIWRDSDAAFYYDFGSVSIPVMDDRITDPIIIGNIHQSPELEFS